MQGEVNVEDEEENQVRRRDSCGGNCLEAKEVKHRMLSKKVRRENPLLTQGRGGWVKKKERTNGQRCAVQFGLT